jgi:hypothetical protein
VAINALLVPEQRDKINKAANKRDKRIRDQKPSTRWGGGASITV